MRTPPTTTIAGGGASSRPPAATPGGVGPCTMAGAWGRSPTPYAARHRIWEDAYMLIVVKLPREKAMAALVI